jgi:hypothetical protein
MIKLGTTLLAIASSMFSVAATAAAHCEGPILDGNTWNLVCAADDTDDTDDDYQCDYFISLSDSQGSAEQQEATGSLSPGQSGVVIWSSAVDGEGTDIVSASIVSGSCSRS